MDIAAYMAEVGQQARQAARAVARSTTAVRNQALQATAEALDAARDELAAANARIWRVAVPTVWKQRCWTGWS